MYTAYCPQCGSEICGEGKKFCFSYSEFFKGARDIIKYKIAESIEIDSLMERDSNKFPNKVCDTLANNGMTVTANFFANGNSLEATSIINQADSSMLGIDFDLNNPKYQRKYVFASELYDIIKKQVMAKNRVLDFMFSAQYDADENFVEKMKLIPLVSDILDNSKFNSFNDQISPILTPEENAEYNKCIDDFRPIRNIMNLFSQHHWALNFDINKFENVENEGKITGIKYNNVDCVKRICPVCGAQVSVYLGVYKQKIISFIGTPTSGKSTFINVIYYKLRSGKKISGVTGELSLCDPYYYEYDNNAQRIEKKLAVEKTAKGIFPVLYVLISKNNNPNKKVIYTFVDVPGEYFIAGNNKIGENAANLNRIRVIKNHSDVLYVVIAAEQLLGCLPQRDVAQATVAATDDASLNSLKNVCADFFHGEVKCKTALLISKSDAISGSMGPNGRLVINTATGQEVTGVSFDKYNRLEELKNSPDDIYYDNQKGIIFNQILEEYSSISESIMDIKPSRNDNYIKQILNNITKNPISTFFVSAYGFYAINNIDSLPEQEKINALKVKLGLDEKNASKVMSIYGKTVSDNKQDVSPAAATERRVELTPVSFNKEPFYPVRSDTEDSNSELGIGRRGRAPGRRGVKVPSREELKNSGTVSLKKNDIKDEPTTEQSNNAQQTYNPPLNNNPQPTVSSTFVHEDDAKKDLIKEKNKLLSQIQENLDCTAVEQSFLDYYGDQHNLHNPQGINALIYFFLNNTNFILDQNASKQLEKWNEQIENANNHIAEQRKLLSSSVTIKIRKLLNSKYESSYEKHIKEYEKQIEDLKSKKKMYES